MSTTKSEFTTVESRQEKYPAYLKEQNQWVCRIGKIPRKPWKGHAFPAEWNSGLSDEDMPTMPHEKAKRWVSLGASVIKDWPDGTSEGDLELGYILPHEGSEISLIDLDDVRRPESGEIHPVARDILERADSYAEISQSGEGIHIFVKGALPDRLAQVIEDVDDEPFVGSDCPGVEIYSSGRVVATTGKMVDGSPETVREGQEVIDYIVNEFESRADNSVDELIDDEIEGSSSNDSEGEQSPYFSVEPVSLVNTSSGGWSNNGRYLNGPHPVHGDSDNSNFTCGTDTWHCFSHKDSGGALQLVGLLEGLFECGGADFDNLSDDEYLELCLTARDEYSEFDEEWKPPYRALLATAKNKSLVAKDAKNLQGMYEYARQVYDKMAVEDI